MKPLDFREDFHPVLTPIKDDLREWFAEHGASLFDTEKQELIDQIFTYKAKGMMKDTKKHSRGKLGRTYNDRLKNAFHHAGKLGLELSKMPTKKGRELMAMIEDLGNNPSDYIYDPQTVTVNQDYIRAFLDELGLSIHAKKDLYEII